MSLRAVLLPFVLIAGLFVSAANVRAQALPPCFTATTVECTEGASITYDFAQLFQLQLLAQLLNSIDGVTFSYSFSETGSLPTGLTLSPSGLLSGTFAASGNFAFTLAIDFKLVVQGQTIPLDPVQIPIDMVVGKFTGSEIITVDPTGLGFNLTQNGSSTSKSVTVTNHGAGAASFTVSAFSSSGNGWLTASGGGTVPAFGSSTVTVTASPSTLQPGTYLGSVTISVSGQPSTTVGVQAVVAGNQPIIELSQTGLRFQAVSGGTATSPQAIEVLNPGPGTLAFTAAASEISGGTWLQVAPGGGSSTAASAGTVTVSVNPAGLQPGDYYGKVTFTASGASNSPQSASVVLNVVSPANAPGAFVAPTGLIFVGSAGGTNPASKTVSITNPSPNSLNFLMTPFTTNGGPWLTATPTSGAVNATTPATLTVQPNIQTLASGVYVGDVSVTFIPPTATPTSVPQIAHIAVILIVLPAGVTVPAASPLHPEVTCAPTKLLPVFTLLGSGFNSTAGWPTAIEVTAVDDCGNLMNSGSVSVTFSSGDPALSLTSIGNGSWTGTWNSSKSAPNVTITALAETVSPALKGSASIGGALQPNASTPSVSTGGVVSAANFVPNQPLAPGSFGAIFGNNLATSLKGATGFPLSTQLGDTSVFLGPEQIPLLFASSGQVNGVIPYDLPPNSTQQLIVQRGNAISIPQPVIIAPALPAVFTQNGAGTGAALYAVFQSNGTQLPNNSPVVAGDELVLYCAGLGSVNPPVKAGAQTPLSPLSNTVNPVTVKFGGTEVHADFAGLAPLFAQLYQINVKVPTGLASGNVPIVVSVGGQVSSPVTVAVK